MDAIFFFKNPTNRVYSTLPSILSSGIWHLNGGFDRAVEGTSGKHHVYFSYFFYFYFLLFCKTVEKVIKKKESLLLFKLLGRLAKKVSHVPKVDHLEKHTYLEKYAYILKCMHISQKVVLICN
jgi:hypothetical protein